MHRLTRTTASAMLLMLLSATPALAIYREGSTPSDPGVIRILAAPATRTVPTSVLIGDKRIAFDQQPIMANGTLMVPLRAVVEGAGGEVGWNGDTRTVTVRLGDRSAVFVIEQNEAELSQDGVYYLKRNMIRMAKAPVIAGGRTLVSADALAGILGLQERPGDAGVMSLVQAAKLSTPAPQAEEQEMVITGTVKETKPNQDGLSMLVAGPAISNGEGSLTWFAVTADTRITVAENGAERQGSKADLAVAQKVDVRPTGPLLMSYPARGGAASIVIHK